MFKDLLTRAAEKITGRKCSRCRYDWDCRCCHPDGNMFMRCWNSITRPGFEKRLSLWARPDPIAQDWEERPQIQNRKRRPTPGMVALAAAALILLALLLAALSGCTPAAAAETRPSNWGRFTVERYEECHIITDTQTGAQYVYYWSGNGGGLAALQDGEG